ncbi:SprT family protein [Paenibacillus sp. IB182496]|uniref:Protein SprT-like n=1 Tax=Paenibacillus sabuli TaxID=2772509 RepID=A0A927BQI0_9BACL|nr:SprT family protein [Paenibacillus sabuli]MBD2844887.1 SprT family protein [Paenibacillus sabuli]
MDNETLQKWVERVSLEAFGLPFRHRATFNERLRTTGGRYFTGTHHIEINPRQLAGFGLEETEKIIKHELCHYHLHLLGRGYRHRDRDFKLLLKQVGGARFCNALPGQERQRRSEPYRYALICRGCGLIYKRKRKIDPQKYTCGVCRGKLRIETLDIPNKS